VTLLTRVILAAVVSLVVVLAIGPFFIPLLQRLKFGQEVRSDGPRTHLKKQGTATMGGYLISFGQLSSILVGAFWEDKLKYLGRVGSGFGKIGDELLSLLSTTPRENSPFEPTPRYKMDVHWVEPLLAAEIEFQEWTPDLKLRQPVFIKLLDVPPQTCSLFPDSQGNKKTEGKQQ
jgi:hypothetical protein